MIIKRDVPVKRGMQMETRRTKADWDKIIEKFNMSDQTQSEFSRENGINVKSLGNQLRKRIPN